MIAKTSEKEQAIQLRKKGKTYAEILSIVPVTKSTLSLWLRSVDLATPQKQRITDKRRAAQMRGAARRKEMRIHKSKHIINVNSQQIGAITKRDLLLIGAALYWAEGTKEKDYRPSSKLQFANSDPRMVSVYMRWLREIVGVADKDIVLTLYLHENHRENTSLFEEYWLGITKLQRNNVRNPVYKKHNPKTVRKNVVDSYRGLVSISVRASTDLNRQVQGWIYGIIGGAE